MCLVVNVACVSKYDTATIKYSPPIFEKASSARASFIYQRKNVAYKNLKTFLVAASFLNYPQIQTQVTLLSAISLSPEYDTPHKHTHTFSFIFTNPQKDT
uniref:Uncharacterized protein n=1 Tax=Ditylum brightwellii TaxID=49249 RepID=A0A7S1ZQ46_9STRA|mmetsp:Transcript_3658/g.5670  ORF Transcript_3658/g.5670 Transcript_3658/m.5670 type:complete len:100 (+) Transcript_3658:101-400(+)